MQLTTIKQSDGIFIALPQDMMANVDRIVSNFDDITQQIHIAFYPKQETKLCPQVKTLSGSLKTYIGTDDEKSFFASLIR